jgi:hypothetical protein
LDKRVIAQINQNNGRDKNSRNKNDYNFFMGEKVFTDIFHFRG